MNEIMLALGDYRFSVATAAFQDLNRSRSWEWAEQARVGEFPSMQFTGKSNPVITMSGVVYPYYKGGFEQVAAMAREADKGVPLDLVAFDSSGAGINLGEWVIIALSDRQRSFFPNGAPRAIDFTLSIKRYAE